MATREDHPVWGVYDLYRTARLNVKYYTCKLSTTESLNFYMDIILLATAPSSAIAGLWFWENPLGHTVWQYLGIVTAIVAILKPSLGLTKKMKKYEEVLSGYKALEHDLHEIKELVAQKRAYDKALQDDFKKALKRKGVLVNKEPGEKVDKKLVSFCQREVDTELPAENFYIPEVQHEK